MRTPWVRPSKGHASARAYSARVSGDSAAFRLHRLPMRLSEDCGWVNLGDELSDGDPQPQVWAIKDHVVLGISGGPKGYDADDLVEELEEVLLLFNARDANDLEVPR